MYFNFKPIVVIKAKDYLKNLIEGQSITLEIDESQGKTDKYGRLLGYVIYTDENINNKLIQEGYPWEYTYNKAYNYQDLFKQSEIEANESGKGLWASSTCNGERLNIDSEANVDHIDDENNDSNTIDSSSNNNSTIRTYYTGERGGCYYINSNGNKSYVDHGYCNQK